VLSYQYGDEQQKGIQTKALLQYIFKRGYWQNQGEEGNIILKWHLKKRVVRKQSKYKCRRFDCEFCSEYVRSFGSKSNNKLDGLVVVRGPGISMCSINRRNIDIHPHIGAVFPLKTWIRIFH
jgi:hypothetical protein